MGMFTMSEDKLITTGARSWYRRPKPQTPEHLREVVEDHAWQMFRGTRLKNTPTILKLCLLERWLDCWRGTPYESYAVAQVTNYLDALKRGGFIKDDWAAQGEVPGEEFFGQFWGVVR
jgi:hypothetical protein